MKAPKATPQNALNTWARLAYFGPTDGPVNDLLEKTCEDFQTPYYTEEDDPIWFSITKLTKAGRRAFMTGCQKILNSLTADQKIRYTEMVDRDFAPCEVWD